MAQFLTNINLNKNELQNARIQNLITAPSQPVEGQIYWNSNTHKNFIWDGTKWISYITDDILSEYGFAQLDVNGVLKETQRPIASDTNLGDVKKGTGLNIDENGTISIKYGTTSGTTSEGNHVHDDHYLQLAGGTLTNSLILHADPTQPLQAATKQYVDAISVGLDFKASAKTGTTENITLAELQTIDSVVLNVNDRVLVKDQTNKQENGIYIVKESAWTRSTDANNSSNINSGLFVYIEDGTINKGSAWVLSTTGNIQVGTTLLEFIQFNSSVTNLNWNNLTNVPTTLTHKFTSLIGDNTSTDFIITHNFNTRDVTVSVYETSGSYELVYTNIELTSVNSITIKTTTPPSINQYKVVIIG